MLRLAVTTSRKDDPTVHDACRGWAGRLGVAFVVRRDRSVSAICREEGVDGLLTICADKPPTYLSADQSIRYYYHPGMALTRLRNLRKGLGDPMIRGMQLTEGDSVLDCTLGRASDALVASEVVGESGTVVGLESSPLLAELTIHGLATYEPARAALLPAFRRIDARRGDHREFLAHAGDGEFDIVYFDPLFARPVEESSAMQPLRPLADHQPLTPETLAEARRVARRSVVIKERPDAELWAELGVTEVVSGRNSTVAYGVVAAEH